MKISKIHLITIGLLLLVFVAIASASAAPTITVISPNGGEMWQRGTTHDITWSYTDNPGSQVKIVLVEWTTLGGILIPKTRTIADNVPIGTLPMGKGRIGGSYHWMIPSNQGPGTKYKIVIQSTSQPTIIDGSNNYFTITYPSITVKSPNGGEIWPRIGSCYTVSWSYTGDPGSTVKIVLLKAGHEVETIIPGYSTGTNGAGSFEWVISPTGLTGSDFMVQVQSISQPSIKDTSNNYFTLTSPIAVTVPTCGETWQQGTPHTIKWTYGINPGPYVKLVLLKGGVEVGTITPSTSKGSGLTGSYTWTISSTRVSGNDYQILVQSTTDPGVKGTSCTFTIGQAPTSSTIIVTSPNGGESWKRGTTHTVTWKYTGSPGSYVKLELLQGGTPVGTATYSTPIGSGGTGSYTWTISSTRAAGTNYRMRITSVSQPTISDTSNGDFTITA